MADIGDRLRQIRGRQSRQEFADELGIHPQTLYMYEKGKRVLDVDLVQRICLKYAVSVEWLIFGEGELQAAHEAADQELEKRLAEKEALLAAQDARINELKNELIATQAGALKAYELAVGVISSSGSRSAEAASAGTETADGQSAGAPGRGLNARR